ncbi:MAG TPA: ATPase, partial [Geobacteraceae bacterium]
MVDIIKLPHFLLERVLETLKKERQVEVKGADSYTTLSYRYRITDGGRERANRLMEICRYAGPAPVSFASYADMVESQTVKSIDVSEAEVSKALSHLVLSQKSIQRLGPAISSGQALFLHGPPGNGKSAIAEAIASVLPDTILIPYAVTVGGQIINIYDPVSHIRVTTDDGGIACDQRWISVRRPVVMTGGELTMRMLDLDFNTVTNYYEASLQMKANNGLLIIDDFGRQQVDPHQILNRWIVPLDRRIDYMTLHTGMKFTIPFDILLVFATNIEPQKLVDEAFLRRIRYKIKIDHPTEKDFVTIFRTVCAQFGVKFNESAYTFMIEQWYRRFDIRFNACHPRDIVEHIVNYSRYFNKPLELDEESIMFACENYFVTD